MHKAIAPGGPYRFAWLTQKCMMCDWKETTHGIELELCPKCGAPVDPKRTLQSGVLRIEMAHKKNRFYVHEHEPAAMDEELSISVFSEIPHKLVK